MTPFCVFSIFESVSLRFSPFQGSKTVVSTTHSTNSAVHILLKKHLLYLLKADNNSTSVSTTLPTFKVSNQQDVEQCGQEEYFRIFAVKDSKWYGGAEENPKTPYNNTRVYTLLKQHLRESAAPRIIGLESIH